MTQKSLQTNRQTDGKSKNYIPPHTSYAGGIKMVGNNPKLDLVNVDVHTKFSQIPSIPSQDIMRKQNSDVNQGPSLRHNLAKQERRGGRYRTCIGQNN